MSTPDIREEIITIPPSNTKKRLVDEISEALGIDASRTASVSIDIDATAIVITIRTIVRNEEDSLSQVNWRLLEGYTGNEPMLGGDR